MKTERGCDQCQRPVGPRHFCLDQRIQRLTALQSEEIEGGDELISVMTVDEADSVACFCDATCWAAAESETIQALGIRFPYPHTGEGLVGPCSRCGIPFSLTQPHLAYAVLDQALEDHGGTLVAEVHEDECLAHFCPDCAPPAGAASAEIDAELKGKLPTEQLPVLAEPAQ
jgi:hypothetical protein